MQKLFSEPLIHFTLIGVALFFLYQGISPDGETDRSVVVTEGTVALLSQQFSAVWMRPPTAAEIRGLVDTHIKEEILYREGVAMGLDRNDKIIQRRVLQKLEVLSEETSALSPPTDAELDDYLDNNAARYATAPILDLQQVMFDPARHGVELEAVFNEALKNLNTGVDPATVGDSSLLPRGALAVSLDRVAREFGRDFADAIVLLPAGSWQGPVHSGFGVHIVRIDNLIEERAATLADVRATVERDWENERRTSTRDAYYQGLLKEYDVRVEVALPETAEDPAAQ